MTPALVEFLLLGDSTLDPFLEFVLSAKEIEDAWQRHGEALKAEARRLGIPVPTGPR